jgi:hypothetical protein
VQVVPGCGVSFASLRSPKRPPSDSIVRLAANGLITRSACETGPDAA